MMLSLQRAEDYAFDPILHGLGPFDRDRADLPGIFQIAIKARFGLEPDSD